MTNQVKFRTTEPYWRQILTIAGAMVALLAWMTLAILPAGPWLVAARVTIAAASACAGASLLWLLVRRQLALRGTALGYNGAGVYTAPAMVVLLIASLAFALWPMPPGYDWLGTVGTALCMALALALGLSLARNGTPVAFRQAQYAHRQGDDHGALALLARLERERPDFYGTYQLYAHIHRKRGDYASAAAACERLIAMRPELYFGYAELGLTLLAADKPAEARRVLQKAAETAPRLPQAHFNLGMAYVQLGEQASALDALSCALRLGLRDQVAQVIARYHLMNAFVSLGYSRQARTEWRRLRRARGVLARWRSETDGATPLAGQRLIAEIERAIETYPDDAS
ncbi:MAG: hypothetical protein FJZ90_01160 [Chloroflexi bacterium]|nr:hypothetical protein [Chloroflexota bacterium]